MASLFLGLERIIMPRSHALRGNAHQARMLVTTSVHRKRSVYTPTQERGSEEILSQSHGARYGFCTPNDFLPDTTDAEHGNELLN